MTCGIYRLVFKNTDKVYIGQSVNIEKRYKQHICSMRNATATIKLLDAYKELGYPELDILVACLVEELDTHEEESIEIFNSVDNGFNTHRYANEFPCLKGVDAPRAKYTRQQILNCFTYLLNSPEMSALQISTITSVDKATISNISIGISHLWLKEELPLEYSKLMSTIGTRSKASTITSDKLSAKSRGIIYPKIKDPLGNVYNIENAYKFAKEHGLAGNHFQEVLNGHRKSHKGWVVCQDAKA